MPIPRVSTSATRLYVRQTGRTLCSCGGPEAPACTDRSSRAADRRPCPIGSLDYLREPFYLRHVKGVLSAAFSGDGRGIMQLGLFLLIATPVARVVFSLLAFAIQRDHLYVGITLVVLAVLTFSLTGGQL
jgi:hypothetical protein